MTYSDKLNDPRWQKKRLELLEAANWTCENCQQKTKTLHVHHKLYLRNTMPWDYPDWAYAVFCEECHSYEQTRMEKAHSLIALHGDLMLACEVLFDHERKMRSILIHNFLNTLRAVDGEQPIPFPSPTPPSSGRYL